VYKKLYGKSPAAAAAATRKAKAASVKAVKAVKGPPKPAKVVSPPRAAAAAAVAGITPANKRNTEFEVGEPRDNSTMTPGLTRAAGIAWVAKHCTNQEDPATLEPYAEADLKDLRSVVRLGSGFCYTVDTLDQHIKSSIERGVPIKDMMNPSYRMDKRDFGSLALAGKRLRKTYKLPVEPVEMPAAHYKLFIGVMGDGSFKYVFLYDDRKVKALADGSKDYEPAIPEGGWIGYIPAAGTDELEKLIRKAYSKGRLFTRATRPFICCRFHLKKSKEHWAADTAKKIAAMVGEIRDII
jgi:hypothetical protein